MQAQVTSQNPELIKLLDPRFNLDQSNQAYTVDVSSENIQSLEFGSKGRSSNSQIIEFSMSENLLLSNEVYLKVENIPIEVSITRKKFENEVVGQRNILGGALGTNEFGEYFPNNLFSLKSFPLTRAISNVNLTINNATTSSSPNRIFKGLLKYYNITSNTVCPSTMDYYQNYDDIFVSNTNNYNFNKGIDVMSNNYIRKGERGRGGHTSLTIQTAGATGDAGDNYVEGIVTFLFNTYEPLFCSPFTYFNEKRSSFIPFVNNVRIDLTLTDLIQNMFCSLINKEVEDAVVPAGKPLTELYDFVPQRVGGLGFELKACVQIANPSPESPIIDDYVYKFPYSNYQIYDTIKSENLAPRAVLNNVQFNNINLPNVPNYIMLWVEPESRTSEFDGNSNIGNNTPDSFLKINNLDIQIDNKIAILQNYNSNELFNLIAKRNGYKGDWQEWNYNGSVFLLKASDLSLDPNSIYPGRMTSVNLSVKATVENPSPVGGSTYNGIRLRVITINEGIFYQSRAFSNSLLTPYTDEDYNNAVVMSNTKQINGDINSVINGGFLPAFLAPAAGAAVSFLARSAVKLGSNAIKCAREQLQPDVLAKLVNVGSKNIGDWMVCTVKETLGIKRDKPKGKGLIRNKNGLQRVGGELVDRSELASRF